MFFCRCLFPFFQLEISELPRPIDVILCQVIGTVFVFIIQVTKFGGLPKQIWGHKRLKFGVILDNFRLDQEYFWTDQHIQNQKLTIPPVFGINSLVDFSPLTTKFWVCILTHLNQIFQKTIFRPLGGAVDTLKWKNNNNRDCYCYCYGHLKKFLSVGYVSSKPLCFSAWFCWLAIPIAVARSHLYTWYTDVLCQCTRWHRKKVQHTCFTLIEPSDSFGND